MSSTADKKELEQIQEFLVNSGLSDAFQGMTQEELYSQFKEYKEKYLKDNYGSFSNNIEIDTLDNEGDKENDRLEHEIEIESGVRINEKKNNCAYFNEGSVSVNDQYNEDINNNNGNSNSKNSEGNINVDIKKIRDDFNYSKNNPKHNSGANDNNINSYNIENKDIIDINIHTNNLIPSIKDTTQNKPINIFDLNSNDKNSDTTPLEFNSDLLFDFKSNVYDVEIDKSEAKTDKNSCKNREEEHENDIKTIDKTPEKEEGGMSVKESEAKTMESELIPPKLGAKPQQKIQNIDDIKLPSSNINFDKMVELELQKENQSQKEGSPKTSGRSQVKFKYKNETKKFLEKYKLKNTTNNRKYKYYSDNFTSGNEIKGEEGTDKKGGLCKLDGSSSEKRGEIPYKKNKKLNANDSRKKICKNEGENESWNAYVNTYNNLISNSNIPNENTRSKSKNASNNRQNPNPHNKNVNTTSSQSSNSNALTKTEAKSGLKSSRTHSNSQLNASFNSSKNTQNLKISSNRADKKPSFFSMKPEKNSNNLLLYIEDNKEEIAFNKRPYNLMINLSGGSSDKSKLLNLIPKKYSNILKTEKSNDSSGKNESENEGDKFEGAIEDVLGVKIDQNIKEYKYNRNNNNNNGSIYNNDISKTPLENKIGQKLNIVNDNNLDSVELNESENDIEKDNKDMDSNENFTHTNEGKDISFPNNYDNIINIFKKYNDLNINESNANNDQNSGENISSKIDAMHNNLQELIKKHEEKLDKLQDIDLLSSLGVSNNKGNYLLSKEEEVKDDIMYEIKGSKEVNLDVGNDGDDKEINQKDRRIDNENMKRLEKNINFNKETDGDGNEEERESKIKEKGEDLRFKTKSSSVKENKDKNTDDISNNIGGDINKSNDTFTDINSDKISTKDNNSKLFSNKNAPNTNNTDINNPFTDNNGIKSNKSPSQNSTDSPPKASSDPPQISQETKDENFSQILRQKLIDLDQKIQAAETEAKKAKEAQRKYEKLSEKLEGDINKFKLKKEKELRKINRIKEEEGKRFEKEKAKIVSAMNQSNNALGQELKKVKEENSTLKSQLKSLKEEFKEKETRNNLSEERLRKQYENSLVKINELQGEIINLQVELKATKEKCKKQHSSKKKTLNKINDNNNNDGFNSNFTNRKVNKITGNFSDDNDPSSVEQYADITDLNTGGYKSNLASEFSDPNSVYQTNTLSNLKQKYSKSNSGLLATNQKLSVTSPPNLKQNLNLSNKQSASNSFQAKNNSKTDSKSSNKNQNLQSLFFSKGESDESYDMVFLSKYHDPSLTKNRVLVNQEISEDKRIFNTYSDQTKEIIFPSGLRRFFYADGYQISYLSNKDIRQVYPDKKEVYFSAKEKATQTKYPDGLQVFKFSNGQIEKKFPDGTKTVQKPDGTISTMYSDGYQEIFYSDGSLQRVNPNGISTIDHPDGTKDTLFPDGSKMREFADGRVSKISKEGKEMSYYKK